MIIVGHRGAAGYEPENTLLSLETAMRLGCDKVEIDIRLSKDRQAVIIHDEKIDRTTNGKGKVADKTLGELRSLNCGKGQKIPTLLEVVQKCKGKIPLIMELKTKGTSEAVNQILVENKIVDSSLIISFDSKLLGEIKKINPEIATGFLFDKLRYKFFPNLLWNLAKKIKADYVCAKYPLISKKFIKKAHKLNLKVYSYTINSRKLGEKFKKFGIDEIATDFPKLFLN